MTPFKKTVLEVFAAIVITSSVIILALCWNLIEFFVVIFFSPVFAAFTLVFGIFAVTDRYRYGLRGWYYAMIGLSALTLAAFAAFDFSGSIAHAYTSWCYIFGEIYLTFAPAAILLLWAAFAVHLLIYRKNFARAEKNKTESNN